MARKLKTAGTTSPMPTPRVMMVPLEWFKQAQPHEEEPTLKISAKRHSNVYLRNERGDRVKIETGIPKAELKSMKRGMVMVTNIAASSAPFTEEDEL